MDGYINEKEAAKMVGISPNAMRCRRLRDTGPKWTTEIPGEFWIDDDGISHQCHSYAVQYRPEDVAAWVKDQDNKNCSHWVI